jgi:hypothetical protein
MRDDDGSIGDPRGDGCEDLLAILFGHFQTVLVHQRKNIDLHIGQAQPLHILIYSCEDVLHGAGLFRINLFDGAAGGQ